MARMIVLLLHVFVVTKTQNNIKVAYKPTIKLLKKHTPFFFFFFFIISYILMPLCPNSAVSKQTHLKYH